MTGKKELQKVTFDGIKTTLQTVEKGKLVGSIKDYKVGTSTFVDNMILSYFYIIDNRADIDNALQKLAASDEQIEVREKTKGGSYYKKVIEFDFKYGYKLYNNKTKKYLGNESAAIGFWAEGYHAYIDLLDSETKKDLNEDFDKEENYVHLIKQHLVIDKLKEKDKANNETKRTQYEAGDTMPIKTKSVTSTEEDCN